MKINVVMIEDEIEEAKRTQSFLERFMSFEKHELHLEVYSNADEYFNTNPNMEYLNLFLLDIIMDGSMNGVDIARKIREKNKDVAIMFITKTADFAINGYEVGALDYILKPLVFEDFALKLKKAMRYMLLHADRSLVFKHTDGVIKIRESRIYYIEVMKHYLILHTTQGEYTVRGSMKECEDQMGKCFARCSNSFLVNLRYVEELLQNDVIVHGEMIPLTKLKKNEFILAFNAYAGAL